MIKLIATDMDGTLLNEAGQLPKNFIKTLTSLKHRDIHFVIASGRSYYDLKDFFKDSSHHIDFICDNGAYVVSHQHEPQISLLSKQDIDEILYFCTSLSNIKIILSGPLGMYATPCEKEFSDTLNHYFSNIQIVSNLQEVHAPIHRICICDLNNPTLNSYPILYRRYQEQFKVTVSGDIWLDITNLSVNKGFALQKLQNSLKITKEETMAFGDFYNDIEMLQQAEFSFVMANANEDMFKYGKYMAKSHTENGVCLAIDEYVLQSKLK